MSISPVVGEVPELTLSQRLRIARENCGWEQEDLAVNLEISRGSISGYERGITTPKGLILRRWAELTGVDELWLRTGKPGPVGPGPGVVRREGLEPPTRWLKVA